VTSVSNPISRYSGEPRSKGLGNRGGNGTYHDQAVGKLALIIHPVGVTRRIRVANPTAAITRIGSTALRPLSPQWREYRGIVAPLTIRLAMAALEQGNPSIAWSQSWPSVLT